MNDSRSHSLHARAYDAMDRGDLREASDAFEVLLRERPDHASYHYMRGLAAKYLRHWEVSLQHNLRAIELARDGEDTQAEHWNAAIAATALGRWSGTRRLWTAVGVAVPEGEGPIDDDYGVAVVRLNPWGSSETVFVRRIDPVRARVLNVPLPESGHRFGDIVLHDGASTGYRWDGPEHKVPVFNALLRMYRSDFQTFTAFVGCEGPDDLRALIDATGPGIGFAEDWTSGIAYSCLRCSYGTPHHHAATEDEWTIDRSIGIAAQSRLSVEKLLAGWASGNPGRRIDAVESRECDPSEPVDGHVWWRGPDDDGDG
jgi:hypothetical protein